VGAPARLEQERCLIATQGSARALHRIKRADSTRRECLAWKMSARRGCMWVGRTKVTQGRRLYSTSKACLWGMVRGPPAKRNPNPGESNTFSPPRCLSLASQEAHAQPIAPMVPWHSPISSDSPISSSATAEPLVLVWPHLRPQYPGNHTTHQPGCIIIVHCCPCLPSTRKHPPARSRLSQACLSNGGRGRGGGGGEGGERGGGGGKGGGEGQEEEEEEEKDEEDEEEEEEQEAGEEESRPARCRVASTQVRECTRDKERPPSHACQDYGWLLRW